MVDVFEKCNRMEDNGSRDHPRFADRSDVMTRKNKEYVYCVALYQKYLSRLGELKFAGIGEKIIIPPNRVRYFFIYGNTMYVFCLSFNV